MKSQSSGLVKYVEMTILKLTLERFAMWKTTMLAETLAEMIVKFFSSYDRGV